MSSPRLGSVQSLLKKVRAENAKESNREDKQLELPEVLSIWQSYADNQESQTVCNILKTTELSVQNSKIVATVGSNISKSVILQETALIDQLRNTLKVPKLTIEIKIDGSKVVARPKVLTVREKYEEMVKENPLLEEFRKTFHLDLDNG